MIDEIFVRSQIERKRDGNALSHDTWAELIGGFVDDQVSEAQMAALCMASLLRGLSDEEVFAITSAMVESGEKLSYPADTFVVDKHSSGGVGDVVSLVAVPLVASCGVPVAKLSGRALGHTGGTIDKLEAIRGFRASLPLNDFLAQVHRVGCAIVAQSDAFVPADKRLYRLRDRTGTIPSTGLIASSIVSKKVAAGANAFVFDVKYGSGAFMKRLDDAVELARRLVSVSRMFGKQARALVTDMNEPLGRNVGLVPEVVEARSILLGLERDPRTVEACIAIASEMLRLAGRKTPDRLAADALTSGAAYQKFIEMIRAQGAEPGALEALAVASTKTEVSARAAGYVAGIDSVAIGNAVRRANFTDACAGVHLAVRVGDKVEKGAPLLLIYGDVDEDALQDVVNIDERAPTPSRMVAAII